MATKYAKPGFNYWDGRAPKTKILPPNSTGGEDQYVLEYLDRQQMFPDLPHLTQIKLIWDEKVEQYVIWAAALNSDIALDTYALLIKVIPKCTYTPVEITAGYVENGARILKLEEDSAVRFIEQSVLHVSNPVWPEDIQAGESTDAKPVIAKGKVKYVKTDPEAEPVRVFFLEWITYPVTIMSGRTTTAVTGGNFAANTLKLLWGRNPEKTTITNIKNPDVWTSDTGAYCLIMQLADGSWQAIDLACKSEGGDIT